MSGQLGRLRWTEAGLLIPALAIGLLGLVITNLSARSALALDAITPALVAIGALALAHLWLAWRCRSSDQTLLPLAATLVGLGLAVVWRIQPAALPRQVMWLVIGLLAMGIVVAFPRGADWLKRYKYTWALLGLALVATTLVFGVDPNQSGARLWLGFAGQHFQPSEILKVLLVVFLAAYLDDRRELLASGVYRMGPLRLPSLPHLGPLALMWGLCVLLLVVQRDLGATFLFFGVFLAMLYVASSRLLYVVGGLGMFLIAACFAAKLVSHVQTRVAVWLDPWADPQNTAFQVVQSLLSFASGGVFGVGWGYGYPDYIPAAHTDFPLAVIGEQAGLAGTLAVVALYMFFTLRGFKTAVEATDGFRQLLAVGLTSVIAIQSLTIMGGNLRIIPLTGITLPFVSYGGSSLLANFIILGLLLRISHESRQAMEERHG
ncbi:MAG: FtsW/RodA/SpoVE family cell cycle protein [Chloroflexota bacterium]